MTSTATAPGQPVVDLPGYLRAREGRQWTWRDTYYVLDHVRQVEDAYRALLAKTGALAPIGRRKA